VRGALTTACGFAEQDRSGRRLSQEEWAALKKKVVLSGLLPLRRGRLEQTWRRPRKEVSMRTAIEALLTGPPSRPNPGLARR